MDNRCPRIVRLYFWTNRKFVHLCVLLRALFNGIWLGLLDREMLYTVDKSCYDSWQRYHSQAYNHQGLAAWEESALRTYFTDCRRLLVAGAGGGREVLALCKLGYEVDGFECHPALVTLANQILIEEGFSTRLELVARDECPSEIRKYDGVIIGWGTYMLIQGKDQRIAFLRKMRDTVPSQAPLLLSFYQRESNATSVHGDGCCRESVAMDAQEASS